MIIAKRARTFRLIFALLLVLSSMSIGTTQEPAQEAYGPPVFPELEILPKETETVVECEVALICYEIDEESGEEYLVSGANRLAMF